MSKKHEIVSSRVIMEKKGVVAIVTGGASGLGEACVHQLVREEAKVSIFDIAEDRGQKIAADMGDAAIFCNTNVTDDTSVQNALDSTVQAVEAIHVAVNFAGVRAPAKVLGGDAPMSMEQFNGVVQINLMGTVNVIRLSAEKMLRNVPNDDGEKGVIIWV